MQVGQPSTSIIHSANQILVKPTIAKRASGNIFTLSLRSNSTCWILDSSATNHICSSLNFFTTYRSIPHVSITLPNGSQVYSTMAGMVYFSNNLVLDHMLYLPHFAFNLISITKLTSFSNCIITFTDKFCELQDRATTKTIRLAKVQEGLYVLQSPGMPSLPPISINNVSVPIVNKCHYCNILNPEDRLR